MPNTTYYQDTTYGYNIYTVLPTQRADRWLRPGRQPGQPVHQHGHLPANNAAICQTATQSMIHQFGFDSLTCGEGTCGSTTTTGNT